MIDLLFSVFVIAAGAKKNSSHPARRAQKRGKNEPTFGPLARPAAPCETKMSDGAQGKIEEGRNGHDLHDQQDLKSARCAHPASCMKNRANGIPVGTTVGAWGNADDQEILNREGREEREDGWFGGEEESRGLQAKERSSESFLARFQEFLNAESGSPR